MFFKKYGRNIIIAVFVVGVFFYIGRTVYLTAKEPYTTEIALEKTVSDSIDATFFFIRDEEYITTKSAGYPAALVSEGAKIGISKDIFSMCSSEDDARNIAEINETENKIERYTKLQDQDNSMMLNFNTLDDEIYDIFNDVLKESASGDLENLDTLSNDFRDKMTVRQIAVNGAMDFTQKINELEAELAELNKKIKVVPNVKAASAGYFSTYTDGFEGTINYKKAESLTPEALEKAFNTKAGSAGNAIGKIVKSYNWYIAAIINNKEADNLRAVINEKSKNNKADVTFKILFPFTSTGEITCKFVSLNNSESKSTVIFSCNIINEDILKLRTEKAKIVMKEYTGYQISKSALRSQDNKMGVFVLKDSLIKFINIDEIYTGSDFVLAALKEDIIKNPDIKDADKYINLYDRVITQGKDLYDDKVIN